MSPSIDPATGFLRRSAAVVVIARGYPALDLLDDQVLVHVDDRLVGLPGGKAEGDESHWDCMVRECLEETGVLVRQAYPLVRERVDGHDCTLFVALEAWLPRAGQEKRWPGPLPCDCLSAGWVSRADFLLPAHVRRLRFPGFFRRTVGSLPPDFRTDVRLENLL